MTSVIILAFGQELYTSDIEQMRGVLITAKFEIAQTIEASDLIVLHANAKGELHDFWATLTDLEKNHPNKPKIISGCIPKGDSERINKYTLVGTRQIHKIAEAVEETLADNVVQLLSTKELPPLNLPRVRTVAYTQTIPIARACQGTCGYCKSKRKGSPYTSYPIEEIKTEVAKAIMLGAKEIILATPDGGAYGLDIKTDFPTLLRDLVKIEGDYIIHLPKINPQTLIKYKDDFLSVLKSEKIRKYLQFQMYHTSISVLEDMGKTYNTQEFIEWVITIKERFPSINIEVDLLIGHPLASEQDFWQLQTTIRKLSPDKINIIDYNPKLRVQKDAKEILPLPDEELGRRMVVIIDINNNISKLQNERWRDWAGPIIIEKEVREGVMQGRNFAYKPIHINTQTAKRGDIINVKVTRTTGTELLAEVVPD